MSNVEKYSRSGRSDVDQDVLMSNFEKNNRKAVKISLGNLQIEVSCDREGKLLHQQLPRSIVGPHEPLGVQIGSTPTALDRVAGKREGGSSKSDDWDLGGQILACLANRFVHKIKFLGIL